MPTIMLRLGTQVDIRIIRDAGTGSALTVAAVGNYIAKYATKAVNVPGVPDCRITDPRDIPDLTCNAHYRKLVETCWQLGRVAACRPVLHKWSHMLDFGGHFLTKSRRYSITFGALRAARRQHRRAQAHPDGERDPWGRPLEDTVVLVLKTWTVVGFGYTGTEDDLATASAARAREHDHRPPPPTT